LWIEWNDAVHKQVIYESGSSASPDPDSAGMRVVFYCAGQQAVVRGLARTFWSDPSIDGERNVVLSPLETHFDLSGDFAPDADVPAMLLGELAGVTDAEDAGVSALLECVAFGFDSMTDGPVTIAPPRSRQINIGPLSMALSRLLLGMPLFFWPSSSYLTHGTLRDHSPSLAAR
jgi:hypothetical protein